MHLGFIFKKAAGNISSRKFNFVLTLVVMLVTLYLIFDVSGMYFKSNYYIYKTEQAFADKEVININVLMDIQDTAYSDHVEDFLKQLEHRYEDRVATFMYMDAPIENAGTQEQKHVLYLNKNCMGLGKLEIIDQTAADGYIRCYVCRTAADKYPLGTIVRNQHTDSQMMVAGYFDSETVWLPTLLFHSQEAVVSLDEYIVSEMDEAYFKRSKDFYTNMFNSIYIKDVPANEQQTVKLEIREIANETGVMCYEYTLDDLIQQEKGSNKELMQSIGMLILFVVLLSVSSIFTACLADVFSRRTEIAIMSVNGVSPVDLYMMLLVENMLKLLISFGIAFGIYISSQNDTGRLIGCRMVLPAVLLGGIICMLLVTTVSHSSIRQRNLLAWMGGAKL